MFQHYINRSVGLHRNAPRIYLDDAFLASTGFLPGTTYNVDVEEPGSRIVLRLAQSGSRKVSSKTRRGRRQPVIDINSCTDLFGFHHQQSIRIVITQEAVYILITASERNRRERLARMVERLSSKKPLRLASFAHGIGVMSNAAHCGLQRAGVHSELALANEIDPTFIGQSMNVNSVWGNHTKALVAPMQEVVQDRWLAPRLADAELLECGIPCSGASIAGKSKRGLTNMEAHPTVGHLVAPLLMVIQMLQPVVVCVENVEAYASTSSADILRKMLHDMAYAVHEVVIDARAHGALEGRTRWFLVAVTEGIELDLNPLERAQDIVASSTVADDLDPVPDDHPSWRTFDYLFKKEQRDATKGNCFAMQIVAGADRSVPTMRKGYHKGGSTDPLLQHPNRDGLFRKFTPAEHARFKRIPEKLVEGLSDTTAHQGLGQSVAYPVVETLFNLIGEALQGFARCKSTGSLSNDDSGRHCPRVATG